MIKLVTIGKSKNSEFETIFNFYAKLISQYTKLQVLELEANNNSGFDKLKLHINPNTYLLDVDGKEYSSESFAEKVIKSNMDMGRELVFVIGGPKGFNNEEKSQLPFKLSLSTLTTTHQFAKLILMEQIYRAFTISNGKEYHY